MTAEGARSNPAQTYQDYLVPALFEPWAGELLARVSLVDGEQVLDVACGTGAVARRAAALVGPRDSVTAVDISAAMLNVARSLPPADGARIDWVEGRADVLPFGDTNFDVVLCQQGLQFVPNRSTAVQEMHRVLKPGGRGGVSVWRSVEHQSVTAALFAAMDRQFGVTAQVPFSLGDAGELRTLFVDAGFRNVTIEDVRRQVRFPSIERYVALSVLGASAAIPALANATDAERDAAIEAIRLEIRDELESVRDGDGVAFPMASHIAIARM